MKITDQELKTLQDQEKKKNSIAHDLGVFESKKHDLLKLLDDVREHQDITFEDIQENYGKISINPETGEYDKIKEEETK